MGAVGRILPMVAAAYPDIETGKYITDNAEEEAYIFSGITTSSSELYTVITGYL
jgi:hypothetical protein